MKKNFICLTFIGLMCLATLSSLGQTAAFNYQGRLADGGAAANGTYEMQFKLFDASTGGTQIGSTVTLAGVTVAGGNFSVALDFGMNSFPGADRYLEISVKKPAEGAYTTLAPRQQLASVPYAVHAASVDVATAGDSVVNAINDASTTITISESRLPANIVRLNPTAVQETAAPVGTDALISLGGIYTSPSSIFRLNNNGSFFVAGDYDGGVGSETAPIEGSGTRMSWQPSKGAFRAGSINGTQWDNANIGYFSAAFGENVRASGDYSFAVGRNATAAQTSSFAAGENVTATGAASVALGYGAHTNARQGSFVFADRTTVDEMRAGVNHSANWRVSGGFRVFTASNLSTGVTIQSGSSVSNWGQANAVISTSTGALLSTGGVWTNASSRNLKDNFAAVDTRSILRKVLSLPIQTWNYKAEDASVRHIGPFSQDFRRAFDFGGNDEAIGTVDADGVALAAIQGLNEELQDRDRKIERLETELGNQRQQIEAQQKAIEELKKLFCLNQPAAEGCKRGDR